jgi:hypothetical protein
MADDILTRRGVEVRGTVITADEITALLESSPPRGREVEMNDTTRAKDNVVPLFSPQRMKHRRLQLLLEREAELLAPLRAYYSSAQIAASSEATAL